MDEKRKEHHHGRLALGCMWANFTLPHKPVSRGWYYFNIKSVRNKGWFLDVAGKWYYSSKETEGFMGRLAKGWHKDASDGKWIPVGNGYR